MTKKKEKINEGMIMISSLLPVGENPLFSIRKNKKDNFSFKGFPGQFNEQGEKVFDEYGNRLNESVFTKRHYNMLAKILKDSKTIDDVVNKLADIFEKDNPLFKKELFLKAVKQ